VGVVLTVVGVVVVVVVGVVVTGGVLVGGVVVTLTGGVVTVVVVVGVVVGVVGGVVVVVVVLVGVGVVAGGVVVMVLVGTVAVTVVVGSNTTGGFIFTGTCARTGVRGWNGEKLTNPPLLVVAFDATVFLGVSVLPATGVSAVFLAATVAALASVGVVSEITRVDDCDVHTCASSARSDTALNGNCIVDKFSRVSNGSACSEAARTDGTAGFGIADERGFGAEFMGPPGGTTTAAQTTRRHPKLPIHPLARQNLLMEYSGDARIAQNRPFFSAPRRRCTRPHLR
jgi:hypothetical protein